MQGGNKGVFVWDKKAEVPGVVLPKDRAQLPDVFVYLYKGKDMICYARLAIDDVLDGKFGGGKVMRAKWGRFHAFCLPSG